MKLKLFFHEAKDSKIPCVKKAYDNRDRAWKDAEFDDVLVVNMQEVHPRDYDELEKLGEQHKDLGLIRSVKALRASRAGDHSKKAPNIEAGYPMLKKYIQDTAKRGWIYKQSTDGVLTPYMVRRIKYNGPGRDESPPYITVDCEYRNANKSKEYASSTSFTFYSNNVTHKTPAGMLASKGFVLDTKELDEQYDSDVEYYRKTVRGEFAKQFRLDKTRKVIMDSKKECAASMTSRSVIMDTDLEVPIHLITTIFDLKSHEHTDVHSRRLTPYVYDKTLINKLVLPESHKGLLDVLTTNLTEMTTDIVEGKSAGNIILAQGLPGVGKTLTAEIYSEVTEKPLYSVHSGSLGTSPSSIRENLEKILERQQRWDCVLLLDEADVFVLERGRDVVQNAIVAEFLRVLEYFAGLLFMTTNREDIIDEAIISRCAAIIRYSVPDAADRKRLWEVMFKSFDATAPDGLVEQLVTAFPSAAGRDIKMLLRLVLRVSGARKEALTIELFRKYAMFRAMEIVV